MKVTPETVESLRPFFGAALDAAAPKILEQVRATVADEASRRAPAPYYAPPSFLAPRSPLRVKSHRVSTGLQVWRAWCTVCGLEVRTASMYGAWLTVEGVFFFNPGYAGDAARRHLAEHHPSRARVR